MTDAVRNLAFVGLPGTGKTTYLGALWQVIQDAREPSVVELDFTGDRAYLQEIGGLVASGEEVRRTDVGSTEGMALGLRFHDDLECHLSVPDLSGETVRMLVEERVWDPNLHSAVLNADALILFVHPDTVRSPMRRNSVSEMANELGVSEMGEAASPEPVQPFEHRLACTGAALTDVLENMVELQLERRRLRLAIVASAWDRAEGGGETPKEWLQDRLPAIAAWCTTNSWRVRSQVFGVSAIGGQLPDDRDSLLAKGAVSQRAYAHTGDGAPVSITGPLQWALASTDE